MSLIKFPSYFPSKACLKLFPILCVLIFCPELAFSDETVKAEKEGVKEELAPLSKEEQVWIDVRNAQDAGDFNKAASILYNYHLEFPDNPNSVDALWLAFQIKKKISLESINADWESIRDLLRRFISFYPKSLQVPEAYFELGQSYFYMHFYREALTYFRLFLKKYPESPLVYFAKEWQARVLLKIGKNEEAEILISDIIEQIKNEKDKALKTKVRISIGDVKFEQKKYKEARDFYQIVMDADPQYYMTDPEILRRAGLANIKYGKILRGRKQLYHYLNIAGITDNRINVLYGIAESYRLDNDDTSAKKLYDQAVKEGDSDSIGVLLSKLRIAIYLDDPEMKLTKWEIKNDLTDARGDEPYLAVIEKLSDNPVAQTARYGLYLRFKSRGDLEETYKYGREYLKNAGDDADPMASQKIATVFQYLLEELLKNKKYQEIYDLYYEEYQHLKDFMNGRVLYLVGQAMDQLNLYDQAAVVYFRAMKWPLSDEERIDIYYRRARVYLALKDYESADLLLTHLRKIYKGKPELGEINHFCGQLAEARSEFSKALEYYYEAVENPTFKEKRASYATDVFRLALEIGDFTRAIDLFTRWREFFNDDSVIIQEWSLRIGNSLRLQKDYTFAISVYQKGISEGLPQESLSAQAINLYLGDCYYFIGDKERGLAQYQKVLNGSNFWKQLATERINQHKIDQEIIDMRKALN